MKADFMDDLIKKIQGMALTRIEQDIADYILEHFNTVGLQTSTSLSESIGVSDTSIIRFVRRLGFKGYSEFRSKMSEQIVQQYQKNQGGLSTWEKYVKTRDSLNQESLIRDVSGYTLDNLEKSFSGLESKTIHQVSDIILKSHRKYIAGFRGTASCAQYMASKLLFLTPNVIPILNADATAVEKLFDITQDDCLFLYSFPRYSEINSLLIELAYERHAKIILMTDRLTCPFAGRADAVIAARVKGLGFTNSYVAPISLSEVILLAVSGKGDGSRVEQLDAIMDRQKLY